MINRELMTSDRWIACTWPARALYSAMYAFADRDGRLPANRRVLMARTEALAVCDLRSFSRWVDEMVRNGLLLDGKCMAGKEFVEFYKFKGAQPGMPYDREPTGEFPTNAAEAQPPVRSKSGTKHERAMNMPCGSEVKGNEIEEKWKGSEGATSTPAPPSGGDIITNGRDSWDVAAEGARIGVAYQSIYEEDGRAAWYPNGSDQEAIRNAARCGSCRPWPTHEALREEILRTQAGCRKRGMNDRLGNLLRHIGESWDDRKDERTGPAGGRAAPIEAPGQPRYPTIDEAVPWAAEARKDREEKATR